MFQVPSLNKRLIFRAILFTGNHWQEAVFEKRIKAGIKSYVKSSQQRNEIWLRTTMETPFLTFSNQFSC